MKSRSHTLQQRNGNVTGPCWLPFTGLGSGGEMLSPPTFTTEIYAHRWSHLRRFGCIDPGSEERFDPGSGWDR